MSNALIRLQFMKIVQDMKICKGPDSMKARDGAPLETFLIAAAGISPRNGGHISSLARCRSTVTFTQALIYAVLFLCTGTFQHTKVAYILTRSSRRKRYCSLPE